MSNIPRLDWCYHTDEQLAEMVARIHRFLAQPDLDALDKDNCRMLLGMVEVEQAERRLMLTGVAWSDAAW